MIAAAGVQQLPSDAATAQVAEQPAMGTLWIAQSTVQPHSLADKGVSTHKGVLAMAVVLAWGIDKIWG